MYYTVIKHDGHLRTQEKFQDFSSKSVRGRLREVATRNSDLTWKLLVFWKTALSLRRAGRNWRFDCTLFQQSIYQRD